MLLIPILIILAIVGFSYGGTIIKDFHFGLPDFSLNLGLQTSNPQKKVVENKSSKYQQIQTASPPRAPPPSSTSVKEKTTNSPYFQKIRISNFQATTSSQPARITLNTNFSSSEPAIPVTGWKLASMWNGAFTIPHGTSQFHPNMADSAENIVVRANDTLYLRGEANPFGKGINFKPNACFGYLNQYYQNLPESFSCSQQKPSIAEIKNLNPTCQDFLLNKINYGACKLPNYATDPSIAGNQECASYITNPANPNGGFTYEGCFAKHRNDPNFISNAWYLYMDASFGNSLHDSITLYDQNGLVVDTYTY